MCRWYLVLCSESESENESCSVVSDSLQPHGLHSPWNSPGQNMRVGSCSLLQGIFPTLGLNSGFLHSRQILYQLSPQASAQILEWVAYPFSSRSFRPRNWTRVSCIAGRFFTSWATREAHRTHKQYNKSLLVTVALGASSSRFESKFLHKRRWGGHKLLSNKPSHLWNSPHRALG